MKLKRYLALAAALLMITSIFSSCNLLPKEEDSLAPPLVKPKMQDYEVAKVTKGLIEQRLAGSGIFISGTDYPVYFTVSGKRAKNILAKVSDIVKIGQVLVDTEIGDLETQIKLEEYSVQLKQIDLNVALNGTDTIQKQKAQINFDIEKTKLNSLRSQLTSSKLLSPVKGQVTFVENFKAGDSIDAYKTLMIVGDTSKLSVAYFAPNVTNLTLGMIVQVTAGGKTVTGRLTSIPSATNKDTTDKFATYLKITLDQLPTGAVINGSCDVNLLIAQKNDVLTVPLRAIRKLGNTYTATVWDGTSKKDVDITIGLQSDTNVEVTKGLFEGQNVILN